MSIRERWRGRLFCSGRLPGAVLLLLLPALPAAQEVSQPSHQNSETLPAPDYLRTPTPDFQLPPIETAPEQHGGQATEIFIRQILFSGPRLIPADELQQMAASVQGRQVTLDELMQLRDRLTRRLVDAGYVNSGAMLDDDALHDGVLTVRLVAGRLEDVRVKGQQRLRADYIRNRLRGEPGATLQMQALQTRFQRLLADPLIERLHARVLPGSEPGLAILDVDAERARPYQLTLFSDNYRPPSIGAEAFGLSAWVRNITGLGDLLDFTYTQGAGTRRYSGGVRIPLTDWGVEAYARFDEGDSLVVEEDLRRADIKSEVHSLEGGVSLPLFDTLEQRLALGLGFGVRSNTTQIAGIPQSFVTGVAGATNQVSALRFFQDYLRRWERDVLILRSTLSFGLPVFGATRRTRPEGAASEYFAWLLQAQYAHRFDNEAQAVLRGNVQFSDAPLLPLERFAVGGVSSVRGYRENELVRDAGYSVSAEWRVPVLGEPDSKQLLQVVPFFDHGRAWDLDGQAKSLQSIGVGLSGDYGRLHGELYYAYALAEPVSPRGHDLQDRGIHFEAHIDVFN